MTGKFYHLSTFFIPVFLGAGVGAGVAEAAFQIEGKLLIKGTSDPLPEANVFVLPDKLKATTNSDGSFLIEGIESRDSTLIVNTPGYQKLEEPVTLEGDLKKTFRIEPAASLDYETTIQSSEDRDQVKRTLSKKSAALQPGAGSDPIRAVQNLPGVNRAQGFTSQVIIQGSAPEDTRYTIDGHEIPLIFHFGGLSSVFNPDLTESFDFLSAGYQSNYGRAMGGLLNLNTRDVNNRRLKGSAFIDTFNSGATLETPVGEKGQLAIGGRISYVGQVLKAIFKDNEDFALTVAPTYGDLSLIYQRPLSSRLDFKWVMIGSKDSLDFVANNALGNDPALRGNFSNQIGFFRIIPEFQWTHSERSKTKFSVGFGRDFINTNIGANYFNLRTLTATIRAENRTRIDDTLTLAYGMDHRITSADVSFKLPVFNNDGGVANPISVGESRIADLKQVPSNLIGIYLNPTYKPSIDSPWTFYPGFRIDYFAQVSDLKLGPRLGARYQLSPDLSLSAAGGLYAQPPREQESSASYGNPNIKAPECWHIKVGAEKDLSAVWSRGSQAYSGVFGRWFRKLIIPDLNTTYSNLGSGQAIGWENSVKYNFEPWNFYGSYTLSRSTREDPNRSSYLYQYDQTHFLTLIAGVNLKRNWRISSRFRYVTGPLDTIPIGAVGDLDNDVFIPIRGSLFNSRLDAFTMLDLRIDKKWIYESWSLSLYLDILNVLNRQNTEGLQFSYDYALSEPVKGFPILPTFGLKGEF